MNSHVHFIGPKKPGRPCPDVLRCILCGVSTNRKQHESCELGSGPGGRLCASCAAKAGPDCPRNCEAWVQRLLPQLLCQICTSRCDDLLICAVCCRDICTACAEQSTFYFWADTGKADSVICAECFPAEARFAWDVEDFCVHCMSKHPGDGSIPPCRDSSEGTPIVHALRNKSFSGELFLSLLKPDSKTINGDPSSSRPSSRASVVGLPHTHLFPIT